MNNKEQITYELLFIKLKEHILSYINDNDYYPKEFHCEFDLSISNAAKNFFNNQCHIRYCIWHFKRALDINMMKICYNEVENNDIFYVLYKCLTNLPFINSEYVLELFELIKSKNKIKK